MKKRKDDVKTEEREKKAKEINEERGKNMENESKGRRQEDYNRLHHANSPTKVAVVVVIIILALLCGGDAYSCKMKHIIDLL